MSDAKTTEWVCRCGQIHRPEDPSCVECETYRDEGRRIMDAVIDGLQRDLEKHAESGYAVIIDDSAAFAGSFGGREGYHLSVFLRRSEAEAWNELRRIEDCGGRVVPVRIIEQ